MLKNGGYLIIHDEFRDHEHKCDFIKKHSCTLVRSFYLNDDVWWNDYYLNLKKEIDSTNDLQLMNAFSSDLTEIEYFRKDPSLFRSVYHVVR